ncbi:outer membrane beta-barrel protein [Candidatus Parabeggiatoa sp. HSG14]|uniref:outer membrane beta-barrel protein n=1 Tax=Candidatus Parabeggiatoa sp. HSG14 TaxID=3055593 RepID=UPI0025A6F9A8|nr:outer membrane beta-barrel protein [Thiotrichales bacterium HSG14]
MKIFIRLTFIFILGCNTALANIKGEEGKPLGPFRLFSELGIAFKYDDNILRQPDNEMGSAITVMTPLAKLKRQQRGQVYKLLMRSEMGRYTSSPVDDYDDWLLLGEADWQLTRRANLKLSGDYRQEHDARGTTDRADTSTPREWHATALKGKFNYGRKTARGRIEAELGHVIRRYENSVLDDTNETQMVARFVYRTLPRLRLFFEASHTITDYQFAASTQDNKINNYSIGAKWKTSAKTSGLLKVGYLKKEFTSIEREDFFGVNWELAMRWIAFRGSTINISTGKYVNNSTGIGDYISTRYFAVTWTHLWKPRLSTSVNFYNAQNDFGGNVRQIPRFDDINKLNFSINYNWHKWLTLKVGVNLTQRDSTINSSDFDQIVWFLGIQARF